MSELESENNVAVDEMQNQNEDQQNEDQQNEDQPTITPGMQWCIIRAATNLENRVLKGLTGRDFPGIGRVLVPTVAERRVKGGEHKVVERRLYPGYVFVEIALEDGLVPDDVWYAIRGVTGVIGMLGDRKPSQVSETEAAAILDAALQKEKRIKGPNFAPGDPVLVRDGSFEGHEGIVEKIDEKKCMATVDIVIFGRSTPVDIEVWQLEKSI